MPSIQDSPYPLVFPVGKLPLHWQPPTPESWTMAAPEWQSLRTTARALDGMQKEAIVSDSDGRAWRLVCDEGPYLNGTDLAPFPLAFFCIGMVSSYLTELLALAQARGVAADGVRLLQDNRYAMEGSAVQGTMTGSALPVELRVEHDDAATRAALQALLADAVASSPAAALLRQILDNGFSLRVDGTVATTRRVRNIDASATVADSEFSALQPAPGEFADAIIKKLQEAPQVSGVPGGSGSSLAEHQKRQLHMRGVCQLRNDGLLESTVELFQPLGSRFRFLTDPGLGSTQRAPSPLAYLSAGVAFCYLTQIGRYCSIVKKPLKRYELLQDTCFSPGGASADTGVAARCAPVITHVFIDGAESIDFARTVVDMSEQTCFLHAACRQAVHVKLKS